MPRRYLRRISRRYRQNRKAWYLRPFAALLSRPAYFAVNRRSVSGALAIGFGISLLPITGHTPIAVLVALVAGVNLGVAALAAWINGPITMVPVFYGEYQLGAWLLRVPPQTWPETMSLDWIWGQLGVIWQPLFLGGGILSVVGGGTLYLVVNGVWRRAAGRRLARRRARQASPTDST
ncbi:MAG: DUF2062 domain-containing protein [Gammaproteobacteria bacterium]|nr:DUF2062 domain-containing protein [Gammaproteobacteria bacterium]